MAGSDLCAITGLTSGAITGVVARLERAGYLRREPNPHDGRKQILHLALERAHIQDVIDPLREDVAALLESFDTHQLTAIAEFLARTTDLIYRHASQELGDSGELVRSEEHTSELQSHLNLVCRLLLEK